MNIQEVKIECDGSDFFFYQYNFKSAMEHAREFIERNKGKYKMKLFVLNKSALGDKWILKEVIKCLL